MLDRLEDYRNLAKECNITTNSLTESLNQDEENVNNDRELIWQFLERMETLQGDIKDMQEKNQEMNDHVQELFTDKASSKKQQEIQDEISELMAINQRNQNSIKETLKWMAEDITEFKKDYPDEPETRVKQTVYRSVAGKFREVLRQTQQIQTDYKNTVQSKIKRQLKIANKDLSEQELDELARDPERAQQVLEQQVIGQRVGVHSKIKNTVSDIQDKYQNIIRLEQNVNELFELFQELATLISAQGEMLDNIEANLDDANDYLEKAEVQLEHAQELHKKGRSRQCAGFICIFIILVVLYFTVIK